MKTARQCKDCGNPHDSFIEALACDARHGKLTAKIGADLQGFGGHLECTVCGTVGPLGNVGERLRDGWPMCCGYTMRWWTQRQIDAGEVPEIASR